MREGRAPGVPTPDQLQGRDDRRHHPGAAEENVVGFHNKCGFYVSNGEEPVLTIVSALP